MRRLKFRAWDKTNKVMLFFANIWNNHQPSRKVSTSPTRIGNMLNDIELMQYTGLKDKNGVEIYEGDILQHPDFTVFKVEWNEGFAGFRGVYGKNDTSNIALQVGDRGLAEVIGNIYESPELLDGKEGDK